ncbi:hypothetical protein ACX12L_19145 [Alicycliphilus sp. T452]|jgi:hypothetical protein
MESVYLAAALGPGVAAMSFRAWAPEPRLAATARRGFDWRRLVG